MKNDARALAADFDDVTEGGDAELDEKLFGQRAGGDADGGFAGRCTLEHAADGAEEFDRAGEVAGLRHRVAALRDARDDDDLLHVGQLHRRRHRHAVVELEAQRRVDGQP